MLLRFSRNYQYFALLFYIKNCIEAALVSTKTNRVLDNNKFRADDKVSKEEVNNLL